MNRAVVEAWLRSAGIHAAVEVREQQAVVVPESGPVRLRADQRHELVALAHDAGFTHISLEIPEE